MALEQRVQTTVWERAPVGGRTPVALAPDEVDRVLGERLVEALERHVQAAEEAVEAEAEVELSGAHLPSAELVEKLREVLVRLLGKAPRMSTREDESLVAGWTVRVGDRLIDASVAGQLAAFRDFARDLESGTAHG